MKKILFILIAVIVFSCKEEVTPDEIIEPSTDTLVKRIVIDVVNDSELRYVTVSLSSCPGMLMPKSFSLTLDQNGVYHLKGKASDLEEEFSYYMVGVVLPTQLLDSVTVLEGEVTVSCDVAKTVSVGIKGKNAWMKYRPTNNNNLNLYFIEGDFSHGSSWGTQRKVMNRVNLYNYSNWEPSLHTDSLFFYRKNEYSVKPDSNRLYVAKYLTGDINSKPITVMDFSCWYDSELVVDPNIEHLVDVKANEYDNDCNYEPPIY